MPKSKPIIEFHIKCNKNCVIKCGTCISVLRKKEHMHLRVKSDSYHTIDFQLRNSALHKSFDVTIHSVSTRGLCVIPITIVEMAVMRDRFVVSTVKFLNFWTQETLL